MLGGKVRVEGVQVLVMHSKDWGFAAGEMRRLRVCK